MNAFPPASAAWSPAVDTQLTCWASAWNVALPVGPAGRCSPPVPAGPTTCMPTGSLRTSSPAGSGSIRCRRISPGGCCRGPPPRPGPPPRLRHPADLQRRLAEGIRQLEPDHVAADAGVDDVADRLIIETGDAPSVPGMGSCGAALQLVTQSYPLRSATAGWDAVTAAMVAARTSSAMAAGSPKWISRVAPPTAGRIARDDNLLRRSRPTDLPRWWTAGRPSGNSVRQPADSWRPGQ